MFHSIPQAVLAQMARLEDIDLRDRDDGTPKAQRLRQIPPETGRFLAILAAGAPAGVVLEVGTSAGYSGLWLALACKQRRDQLFTHELDEDKVRRANETFEAAGVQALVQVIPGNALVRLPRYEQVAFCFIDTEKDLYQPCYDLIIPRLVPGGYLVADNAISHQAELQPFLDQALADRRVDGLLVPIGKGLLLCRKSPD